MVKEKRISKALIPGTTSVGEAYPVFDLMRGCAGTFCSKQSNPLHSGCNPLVCCTEMASSHQ